MSFLPVAICQAENPPFDFFQATHLLSISQGSTLSNMAGGLRSGSLETSDGRRISFEKWYASKWADTRIDFLTQISPRFGVLWGVSTGERGEKYKIEPGFRYGFLTVQPISKTSTLSFSATTMIGGRMKERSCTGDYGELGGVQEVNCRLAATEIEPARTLDYLINQAPPHKNQLALRFNMNF